VRVSSVECLLVLLFADRVVSGEGQNRL
jgi:hypothetical protein